MGNERLEEITENLKNPVRKFISAFEEEEKGFYDIRVYRGVGAHKHKDDSKYTRMKVPDFGNEAIVGKVGKYFRDSAEWVAKTGGINQFYYTENEEKADFSRYPVLIQEDNIEEDPNYEKLLREYEMLFVHIARQTIQYNGDFNFDEKAYELAVEETFYKQFNISREFTAIAPLHNASNLPEMELNDDIDLPDRFDRDVIHNISIRRLTDEERSGMRTWYNRNSLPSKGRKDFSAEYGIVVNITGTSGQAGRHIAKKVTTALRLFKPGLEEIGTGSTYYQTEGWLNYRTDTINISGGGPVRADLARDYEVDYYRKPFRINEEDIRKDFQNFWEKNSGQIRVNTVFNSLFENQNDDISRAIRRFNELYRRRSNEDRIIDISIALESTLLKDIGRTESYSFRMPLRGSVMLGQKLEGSESYIFDFLKRLYRERSRIVHQDKQLGSVEIHDREYSPGEFVVEARSILALILRYYFEQEGKGKNRHQTNQDIDEKIKNFDRR